MTELNKLWEAELEILDSINKFCKENNLKYTLAFGTLIGAVRHGGFIPWDDDVDVIMPRKDYDYLLNHWNVDGFIVQNKVTNDDFSQNFTKIRKDHTTFIHNDWEKKVSYHKGVFVDVFPADKVAPAGFSRKIQFAECALNLLYSREFTSQKRESVVGEGNALLERILLCVPRKMRLTIRTWLDKRIQRWNNTNGEYFCPSCIKEAKIYYPADMFDEMIAIRFENREYMCVKDYDTVLKKYYGDYMKLPPENERVLKHHPQIINLKKNFEEL